MTVTVTSLWRHPIKAVGRESVDNVKLIAGQTMPGDRIWAVAHEASKANDLEWSRCVGFVRAASSPLLMAVEARTEGDLLHLTHPNRPSISVNPDRDEAALIEWLSPLIAEGRAAPKRIVRAPRGRGMTDTSDPSLTLGSTKSHRIVEARAGRSLSIHRWRCNIWVDGLAPWEEFDLVGQRFRLGTAELEAYKRIDRCEATAANPETGRRDADLLSILEHYGHTDFTVGLRVVTDGTIALGDTLVMA